MQWGNNHNYYNNGNMIDRLISIIDAAAIQNILLYKIEINHHQFNLLLQELMISGNVNRTEDGGIELICPYGPIVIKSVENIKMSTCKACMQKITDENMPHFFSVACNYSKIRCNYCDGNVIVKKGIILCPQCKTQYNLIKSGV